MTILQRIVDGVDQLAWSEVLDFENGQHPLSDRRAEIGSWSQRARVRIRVDAQVEVRAAELHAVGLGALDAAHLACAEVGGCGCLVTCDDRFIWRARRTDKRIMVKNPIECLESLEHG